MASNPTIKDVLDNKKRLQVTKPNEKAIMNYPELLPYMLPKHKSISKIAIPSKVVVSPRQILKKPTLVLTQSKEKKLQPLDLAFVGEALFKYLAKWKNIGVFAISICNIDKRLKSLQEIKLAAVSANDINFQMNKTDKLPTDPKTVVSKEYYDFLDMFLKKALDTVTKHSKYDHRIRLLKRHKNLSYSLLCGMLQE